LRKHSIAIRFLNDLLKKFKWKKSHLKIPIELYAIQTLTKLLYCSVTYKKQLYFNCRILLVALHIALICSTTALIRCSDVTRGLSHGET